MRSVIVTKSDMRHTARDLALFKTCLSRCGPVLPLTVSIVVDPIEDWDLESEDVSTVSSVAAASMCRYMRLIMPVRHRLRTAQLVFRIDAPESPSPGVWPWHIDNMPELEYLEAQCPFLREDDEPGIIDLSACNERIRKCIITGCLEMCIADGLTLSNLDVLKLDVLGNGSDTVALAASWYNSLRRMPRLSHLSVCIREGLDWDLHPDTHIDLPKLRELCVRFTAEVEDHFPGYSHAFLNNISCPNLKELKIMCNYPEKPEERFAFSLHIESSGLYPFLRDNGGELDRLVIAYDLFHDTELGNALARCTNLRHLHFRDMFLAEGSELLKEFHLERRLEEGVSHDEDIPRQYCPKLECLRVSRCYIPASIQKSDIVDMIVGRLEKEGSTLKFFEFEDCNLEGVKEDPRIQAIYNSP